MRKQEIETHPVNRFGPALPAINVKVYSVGCTSADIVGRFNCTEEVAHQAIEFWYGFAVQRFWEEAKELVGEVFPHARVYAAGRSGGWLVLSNLADLQHWDACAIQRFARLSKRVRSLISYLTSSDSIMGDIEANRWAEEGAEEYNFFDTRSGETKCISEEKRKAVDAGFGAVIRP